MAGKYPHLDPRQLCVFITGATAGFGQATALRFLAGGARVVALGRRAERLEALARLHQEQEHGSGEGPRGESERLHTIQADVGDVEGMKAALGALPPAFRDVDVLVNNAGFAAGLGLAHESSLEDWHAMVETNIKGVLNTTHLLLPGMVARKRGHVVMMGSVASRYPYPGGNCYGGTKAFVHQFAMNLRADLAGTNVRVTNVLPGMCETEFSLVRFKGDEARAKKVYDGMTPLTAEDIAEVVYWTTTLPAHVNVNALEIMPVQQAFAPFAVSRGSPSPLSKGKADKEDS
ncbi:hypothetical protein NSK_004095 [Nannochloropsis salina CCMP1776]|jgi:3-hydroxy acid dehydrogenase/malonic semialdehyde reductase|uniref:Uncharacterized protein n=2 Tax=Monodopsidaceae TaxID=425072 RepID=A0A4D9CZM7_9STRA|nr:hypothetical protein NSK_004095 [Nannochloropsis salina CCMP1776]|eukprot:TFJ84630.1 hypothetical protein NSK_004095 [Nannochloropsis salina CCMP1776]